MAKKKQKAAPETEALIWVDPDRVRFQHARIRPYFSGCGRSVQDTLEDLRQGKVLLADIPPIQVIIGQETDQGPWYFSLNNRRLWVFKRLREEGLLPNNQIAVRVRAPKSNAEKNRYCLENCTLQAKLMREGPSGGNKDKPTKTALERKKNASREQDAAVSDESKETKEHLVEKTTRTLESLSLVDDDDDDGSSDESSLDIPGRSNPFSVLG